MSDRLKEALDHMDWIHDVAADWPDVEADYEIVVAAARRFVEVAETGETPDYEAAWHAPMNTGDTAADWLTQGEIKAIVDAAVAGRLLVDPRLLEGVDE